MFANFKCPNGLPPSECRHIPQLAKNTFNFFSKLLSKDKTKSDERTRSRREQRRAQERKPVQQHLEQHHAMPQRRSPPAGQQTRERVRSR